MYLCYTGRRGSVYLESIYSPLAKALISYPTRDFLLIINKQPKAIEEEEDNDRKSERPAL